MTTSFKTQLQQLIRIQSEKSLDVKDTDLIFCVNLTNVLLSLRSGTTIVNWQALLIKFTIQEFILCYIITSDYFAGSMAKQSREPIPCNSLRY